MKKLFTYLMLAGMLAFTTVNVYAQDGTDSDTTEVAADGDSTAVESDSAAVEEVVEEPMAEEVVAEPEAEASFHQVVKDLKSGQAVSCSCKCWTKGNKPCFGMRTVGFEKE